MLLLGFVHNDAEGRFVSNSSQGGPTACGWVPNAKDASSSALDDNWPRDVGLHPNDETSCRYATRPEKGRATLRN